MEDGGSRTVLVASASVKLARKVSVQILKHVSVWLFMFSLLSVDVDK